MSATVRPGDDYYSIHLGLWTNWAQGPIKGSTLTLTRQDGGFLIAFLALFVATAGKSCWRLSCFALHHYLSTRHTASRDALYHQRQVILRNSDTAEDASLRLLQMIKAWRKIGRRPLRRLLPAIVLALFIYACFAIAGIFSAHVTTQTANEVLITGNGCGILSVPEEDPQSVALAAPYLAQLEIASLNYASQCYANSTNTQDCNVYVKPRLPLNVEETEDCPFAQEMCSTRSNIKLDTGYIDSREDLGINTGSEGRFSLRYAWHCAPLNTSGYQKTHVPDNSSNLPSTRYYLGEKLGHHVDGDDGFSYQTPGNSILERMDAFSSVTTSQGEYGLGVLEASPGNSSVATASFNPIPQLQRSDADVALFFLSAPDLIFSTPVDDPWYSAHLPGRPVRNTVNNITTPSYLHDEPASVIGCAQQVQICNPNLPKATRCGPPDSYFLFNVDPAAENLFNEKETELVGWALQSLAYSTYPAYLIRDIGVTALKSRTGLASSIQGLLPNNQWQLEVEQWVSASLASLQGSFVEFANGPSDARLKDFIQKPNGTGAYLCKNQKIISNLHSSFSVLGLALILALGGLFILLDYTLEPFMEWIQRKRNDSAYARLEWSTNGMLQLQRLAHEGIGSGIWRRTDREVPVTVREQSLALLDIRNVEHPVLAKPVDELQEINDTSSASNARPTLYKDLSLEHGSESGMLGEKMPSPKIWSAHSRQDSWFDSLESPPHRPPISSSLSSARFHLFPKQA